MKKGFTSILLLCCACVFFSCAHDPDADYYAGLLRLQSGREAEAMRLFRQSARNGSKYVSRRSYEELTNLGNVNDRLDACGNLIKKYDDEEAYLYAARHYKANNEETKLLNLTSNLDYKTCSNQLAALRFKTLYEVNDTRFFTEVYDWFISRPLSSSHYEIFKLINQENIPEAFIQKTKVIAFRMAVYRRSFLNAYEELAPALDSFPLENQIISDYGKACLYGGTNYYADAQKLQTMIPSVKGKEQEYYVNFYIARLYEKAGDYFTLAENYCIAAMESAFSDDKYDNALWYLLNLNLKRSSSRFIKYIEEYCKKWHNPEYFDDLFNMLAPILLSEGKWNDFLKIYEAVDGYASNEVVAKYAYIYGRLVQEGFAMQSIEDTHNSSADASFTRALTSGTDTYYKVMATYQLGLEGEQAEEVLCLNKFDSKSETDSDVEKLLLGYATYGLPSKIYPEWQKFYSKGNIKLSYDAGKKLSQFLMECGNEREEFYPQSLRIAAQVIAKTDFTICKEDLKLLFPRDFSKFVSAFCEKYSVPEEIMYALIRSESFFDSGIKSSAGAVGLTQLMESTAGDISKKLKVPSFNLTNAEDNIEFGTFYLSDLHRRLDEDWLNSFFSYNAGITRVRRWIKSSKVVYNNRTYLPQDLFLETIPYDETREYGRKLVGATVMYGWLYYDKSIREVVKEIVK